MNIAPLMSKEWAQLETLLERALVTHKINEFRDARTVIRKIVIDEDLKRNLLRQVRLAESRAKK